MTESEFRPFEDSPSGEMPVRGYLHVPPDPSNGGLVLAHGAGANCQAPLLVRVADAFCAYGLTVLRCDLPFRQLRPHGPPQWGSTERDQEGLRCAVKALGRQGPGRMLLGGHSYGGRQASILAASQPGLVDALLLLSYPLHPPRAPTQLRTAHLPTLHTPALFVHGTRDPFGTIDEMNAALKLIPARTQLLPIESAGHELMTGRNRSALPNAIAGAFAAFLEARE